MDDVLLEWVTQVEIYWDAVGDIFRLGGDNCSCYSVSICMLFQLLVSLMHQVYIKLFCMRHQLLPEFSFQQLSSHRPPVKCLKHVRGSCCERENVRKIHCEPVGVLMTFLTPDRGKTEKNYYTNISGGERGAKHVEDTKMSTWTDDEIQSVLATRSDAGVDVLETTTCTIQLQNLHVLAPRYSAREFTFINLNPHISYYVQVHKICPFMTSESFCVR